MGYYSAGGDYTAAQLSSHKGFSAARDAAAANDTPPDDLTPSGRRHPRMNPLNPRAARRAMRRLGSFERIARRIVRFTNPRAASHKGHFIKARRRSSR